MMKSIINIAVLLCMLITWVGSAFAIEVNASVESGYSSRKMELQKISTSGWSYEYDETNKTYTDSRNAFSVSESTSYLFKLRGPATFGKVEIPFGDFSIYGKIGGIDEKNIHTGAEQYSTSSNGLAYGGGIEWKFAKVASWDVSAGGNILYRSNGANITAEGVDYSQAVDPGDYRSYGADMETTEWDVFLAAKRGFFNNRIFGSVGVFYGDAETTVDIDYNYYYKDGSLAESAKEKWDYRSDKNVGLMLGLQSEVIDNLFIGVSGKLGAVNSVFANLTKRFK